MSTLREEVEALKRTLPKGALFEFHLTDDRLEIGYFSVPKGRCGTGTAFVAQVLEAADRHRASVVLHADSTSEPGDPTTFELCRWYARFGFAMTEVSEDYWVGMERPCQDDHGDVRAVYEAAKRGKDLTRETYDAFHSEHDPDRKPCP